jgi:predicted O-methyltransferase YrrM
MNTVSVDAAVEAVLAEYEARARREEDLWDTLGPEEAERRIDEMLLPVGRATGTLLEVGSSFGYSTVWLAEAARAVGGKVVSLELRAVKTEYATERLRRAGLADYVEFRVGDALESLAALRGPFDFVLIDLWKNLYVPVWELLHPKLAPGALVIADNMIEPASARPHAQAYRHAVHGARDMSSVLLPVGNGIELSRYQ